MSSERKPEDDFKPVGTYVLLSIAAGAMAAAWLFLYFGVFLPRGSIH